jgi:hypothetical protein
VELPPCPGARAAGSRAAAIRGEAARSTGVTAPVVEINQVAISALISLASAQANVPVPGDVP